jgi:hypothetical protein
LAAAQRKNAVPACQDPGLWFKTNGFYNTAAYDMLTVNCGAVNAGVLTVDGILGRDMLRIGD